MTRITYQVAKQAKRTRAAETPWETIAIGLTGDEADELAAEGARIHPGYRWAVIAEGIEG